MAEPRDPVYGVLWSEDLEEVDREIGRMATLCRAKILEPGVVRRVLAKDASVCGTDNAAAFAKLHDLLMLHLALRQKTADLMGQAQTAQLEDSIIERLKQLFPDLGNWPAS